VNKQLFERILDLAGQLNESNNAEINSFEINFDETDIYGDEIRKIFEMFYELEYKYNTITSPHFGFNGNPVRKENIIKIYENKAREVNSFLAKTFMIVFEEWLEKHALLSAETWARARVQETMDFGSIEESIGAMVGEYKRYSGMQVEANEAFRRMIRLITSNINNYPEFKDFLEIFIEDRKDMYRNDLTNLKEFNENNSKNFKTIKKAEEWIDNLTIDDFDAEDLLYIDSIQDLVNYFENYNSYEEVLVEMYEKIVFPLWLDYWSGQGIEETREKVEEQFESLKKLESLPIKQQFVVVNLATNAVHQTGSMMDYYEQRYGIEKRDLDNLSNQDVSEWQLELKEIGVVFPDSVKKPVKKNKRMLELAGV
jgi:hypothetical protein